LAATKTDTSNSLLPRSPAAAEPPLENGEEGVESARVLASSVTIPRASRGHSLMLALTAFRNVTIKTSLDRNGVAEFVRLRMIARIIRGVTALADETLP
jgi:hypothetical protein